MVRASDMCDSRFPPHWFAALGAGGYFGQENYPVGKRDAALVTDQIKDWQLSPPNDYASIPTHARTRSKRRCRKLRSSADIHASRVR